MVVSAVLSSSNPVFWAWRGCVVLTGLLALRAPAQPVDPALDTFTREIQPILNTHCYDCHGSGISKGGVVLDEFTSASELKDPKLWLRALRNVRSGIMPPSDEPRLPAERVKALEHWIKRQIFELDPAVPDPGRVTVRRLNRTEYRNTVRDLMGVDYDTTLEFPGDDSGHGFDHMGDVLTVSPLLLEKYLDAAQTIVQRAVPMQPAVVAEVVLPGGKFSIRPGSGTESSPPLAASAEGALPNEATGPSRPPPAVVAAGMELSYYTRATVEQRHEITRAGRYQLHFDLRAVERYVDDQFDTNECRLELKVDGETLLDRVFSREGGRTFEFTFDRDWTPGECRIEVAMTPYGADRPQVRQLRLRLNQVTVRGPFAPEHWVKPASYTRFFPRPVPAGSAERRAYAAELLGAFALRAYRRPVDPATIERLVTLAEATYREPDTTFEAGVAQAMVAVLASPRFVFREESVEPLQPGQVHPFVDEYALASRLSYFFWSTMPDEPLFRLAREGRLRASLPAEVRRMFDDPRSAEFIRHFTGQWLQARDIPTVVIDEFAIHQREHPPSEEAVALRAQVRRLAAIPEARRTPEQKLELEAAIKRRGAMPRPAITRLTTSLRQAMLEETERLFEHIVREDRPLTELIDANYTFLNEELAKHYDVPGVKGRAMRKVLLPPESPRGGVLTQGSVLAVTSNPTRTSPVKRGVFVLEAILGTPPAPPPPNIPPLEAAVTPEQLRQMTLRENLAAHASNPICASCHSRMDPLGLALENFNAIGQWRTSDMGHAIDPAGTLVTGESFADIRELKRILATQHQHDFYHNVSEKLLTYALGRGMDHRDTDTLDALTARLVSSGGRPSELIRGIIESAPFQQRRRSEAPVPAPAVSTVFVSPVTLSAPTP